MLSDQILFKKKRVIKERTKETKHNLYNDNNNNKTLFKLSVSYLCLFKSVEQKIYRYLYTL